MLRGVGSVDTNNLVVVDDGNDVVCRNNVRSIDIALLEPCLGYEVLEPTEFTEKAST